MSSMPEEKDGFIPTLNRMGFMTAGLDPYSRAFVAFAEKCRKPALDIGAAFGVASLAALEAGAQVIANDLDERHLAILKERTPETLQDNLVVNISKFPDETTFANDSLGAVLACRVMHFLDGPAIDRGAERIFSWLTEGGKVFVVGETVYVQTMRNFVPEYERRLAAGERWPGYFDDVHERCDPAVRDKLPPAKHLGLA